MRNQLLLFIIFLGLFTNGYAQILSDQELDTCYIYKTIEKASKTPDAVYVLDLTKSKLKIYPLEILTFKNLYILQVCLVFCTLSVSLCLSWPTFLNLCIFAYGFYCRFVVVVSGVFCVYIYIYIYTYVVYRFEHIVVLFQFV